MTIAAFGVLLPVLAARPVLAAGGRPQALGGFAAWTCQSRSEDGTWRAVLSSPAFKKPVNIPAGDLEREELERIFPQLQGAPGHCVYKLWCGTFQLKPFLSSDPDIVKRVSHRGQPAFIARHRSHAGEVHRFVVNTDRQTSMQVMLAIETSGDVKACRRAEYLELLESVGQTLEPIKPSRGSPQ